MKKSHETKLSRMYQKATTCTHREQNIPRRQMGEGEEEETMPNKEAPTEIQSQIAIITTRPTDQEMPPKTVTGRKKRSSKTEGRPAKQERREQMQQQKKH